MNFPLHLHSQVWLCVHNLHRCVHQIFNVHLKPISTQSATPTPIPRSIQLNLIHICPFTLTFTGLVVCAQSSSLRASNLKCPCKTDFNPKCPPSHTIKCNLYMSLYTYIHKSGYVCTIFIVTCIKSSMSTQNPFQPKVPPPSPILSPIPYN